MKMSDVFELPIDTEMVEPSDIYNYLKKDVSIDTADYHAAHAINCHDDLVKAIENLIEADNAFKTGFLHAPELWDHAFDELKCALYKARGDNP